MEACNVKWYNYNIISIAVVPPCPAEPRLKLIFLNVIIILIRIIFIRSNSTRNILQVHKKISLMRSYEQ